jgi:soluble lytic murein transglycosylase
VVALQTLAGDRGYYSFLAAELLGQNYDFGDQPLHDPELAEQLTQELHIQRARELYLMKHRYWAAMEWNVAMSKLSMRDRGVAAEIAHSWGWHHRAIVEAGRSDKLDDLEIRFPTPYKPQFEQSAKAKKINAEWLYAVARQESAFNERARSSAGAMGLLQMLPGTAQEVARDTGRRIKTKQLYQPEYSIDFGATYLQQLMEKFNGNRILATAAYNAGPYRIKRVLENQGSSLPFDIWIENLPYSETRHYVQNVLAYSVIYQKRLGLSPTKMVAGHELVIGLNNGVKTASAE